VKKYFVNKYSLKTMSIINLLLLFAPQKSVKSV